MIYIGIDPAFRKDGFCMAIIDTSDMTIRFKTFKNGFLDFCSWFLYDSPDKAIICVENSNLQNETFDMTGNKNIVARKSRSVGKNQAISQCTVDLCKTKFKVIDCSPKQKGSKWSALQYKSAMQREKIILPKSTSNQDERDAAKLAIKAIKQPYLAK